MMKTLIIATSLLISHLSYASDAVRLTTLATGLGTPWGMTFIDKHTMLITEREGWLKQLDINTGKITSISGLPPIRVEGQGGLFDVAIAPDYAQTGWIYISYNKAINGQGATTLARAKLEGDALSQWQDLLVTQSRTSTKYHYGGRITFDNKGHLFLSVGERGVRDNAQDLMTHAGSILRLNLDGTVPSDNPFVNNKKALPEIWSYGHRNPQGLFYNGKTGILWEAEHGPRGGDEINRIEAGKNYGWPIISYGKEYWGPIAVGEDTKRDGMEQPLKVYIPSIATSSLIQYTGTVFKDWQDDLFIGALAKAHLNQVTILKNQQLGEKKRLFREKNWRVRNVIQGPDGLIYLSTDGGEIIQIAPN